MGKLSKDYIKKHKAWTAYANKELDAGRKPIKFKDYKTESVYYKGITKPTYESQMKAAGVDWSKDRPTARLKRQAKKGK